MNKNMSVEDREHYNENHAWRPHEILLNAKSPPLLHKFPDKDTTAYTWLYIGMAIGLIFLGLLIWGYYWDKRRGNRSDSRDFEARRHKDFTHRFQCQNPQFNQPTTLEAKNEKKMSFV